MKVHPHPFWLCLRAAALITTVATAVGAKEMPVKPSRIHLKARAAKWTIALDDTTSGKVKIWAEDPYNKLAKMYADDNPEPVWDSKTGPASFTLNNDLLDENPAEYWIAFYPSSTKVDLTVSFTRKLLTSTKVVKLKVVQRVMGLPLPAGAPTLTPTNPTGSGATFVTGNFGKPAAGSLVTLD